jgi:hypothetical protein
MSPDPDDPAFEAHVRRAFVECGFVRRDGMSYRRAVPLRSGEG